MKIIFVTIKVFECPSESSVHWQLLIAMEPAASLTESQLKQLALKSMCSGGAAFILQCEPRTLEES